MNLAAVMTLDTGKFLSPLSGARSALGGFGSALASLGNLGNVFTGIQSAMQLARGAIGPLGQAIQSAADFESLSAEFQVMLGSAERARRMIGDIKSFAAGSPFELAGLSQSAKTLLAFGAEGESVVPTLRMLGDVAGSSQEKLSSLTLAFAQISSAGKLQGQDLLQLINAGFNPLQEISRTTGQSMASLREQMEKGAISSQMVADAFRSATSEGGRFFGNTATQGRTYSGILSSLRDGITDLYRAFGEPVMLALKPLLEEAQTLVTGLQPLLADLGTRFAGILASVGKIAADLAKGLLGAFQSGELGNIFTLALNGAGKVFLGSIATGFKAVIDVLSSAFKGVVQSIITLLSDKAFWASLSDQAMSIAYAVTAALASAVADIVDMLPATLRMGANTEGMRENVAIVQDESLRLAESAASKADQINVDAIAAPIGKAGAAVFDTLNTATAKLIGQIMNQPELAAARKSLQAFADDLKVYIQPAATTPGSSWTDALADYQSSLAWDLLQKEGADPKRAESTSGPPRANDMWSRVGAFVGGGDQQVSEQRRTNTLMQKSIDLLSSGLDLWKQMNPGAPASWA